MIAVNQLTVQYGSFTLFKEVSFMINPRDRIGLVGKNGAGKTTLLKIICNLHPIDGGQVTKPNDITIGYLPQQVVYNDGKSVFEETMSAFSEVLEIEHKMKYIEEQLIIRTDHESNEYHDLINQLSDLSQHHAILGGASIDSDVEMVLKGLGFESSDFTRKSEEFSGGWRMRIELAKVLLRRPNVFLLDEPTNHLDIESIQWLEDFLKDYAGAVVLVSHDRAFLDNVTNRTLEITLGKVVDYKVPFSQYEILRLERREQQLAAYNNQQKQIDDIEDFISRFRYKATKAVQVQSRIKMLDKIDRLEVEPEDKGAIYVKFPPAPRSGSIVVEAVGMTKKYDEKLVLDEVDLKIERGEKVAFVGKNGEGKSTMAKIIMSQLQFDGECKLGHNVKVGYFAQNQAELLDKNLTVFETIDHVAVGDIRYKIRDILGAFLFSGDNVDKKVVVLSGGECSRLAMAKLLLEPCSLLLLDEPTNHLDMRSKDVLKQALLQYDGTLIVVSHDRDFLDGLVTKVFEFKHHKIKEHLGGIYDFLQKKKIDSLREIERKDKITKEKKESQQSDNKQSYLDKKEFDKGLRKIKNQITKAEERIQLFEKRIAELTGLMFDNAKDSKLYDEFSETKKMLASEVESWETLNLELDMYENSK